MGKILETGAAGFVGSALARILIKRNFDVTLIDNYSTPSNITDIEGVKIKRVDIRDRNLDLYNYDVLFHLAAISGIRRCREKPDEAFDVNVRGTYNLLQTFSGRVIFPSTSAVYGEAKKPVIDESHPATPLSEYGQTKLEAETLVKLHGNYIIFRFSNIYGRGLFNKRTVTDGFIDMALAKKNLEIHGDGRQRRDFVHLNDALTAYWFGMRTSFNGIYNIGGNEPLSINDVAELVIKQYRSIFGYNLTKNYVPQDCGRMWKDFVFSSDKAKRELGYEPSFSVSDEVRSRLNAYAKSGEEAKCLRLNR